MAFVLEIVMWMFYVLAMKRFGLEIYIYIYIYIYQIGKRFGVLMQAVCNDGILYCIDSCGRIATFDAHNGDWTAISGKNFQHVRLSCFFKFNGELFGVKLSGNYSAVQTIYKLKLENGVAAAWEEVKDMRDLNCVSLSLGF